MEIYPMSDLEYVVKQNAEKCPFCGSTDITAREGTFVGTNAYRDVDCNNVECEESWEENFVLQGYNN